MIKIGNSASSSGIKSLLYYSTSTLTRTKTKTMMKSPVFVNYLISLGLSSEEADPISTKLAHIWQNKKRKDDKNSVVDAFSSSEFACIWRNRGAKTVSDFNFVANADSVVSYLESRGFRESHIRTLVLIAPKILVSKVKPTLQPKVEVFLNMGLSVTDLTIFVGDTPSLFYLGLNSTIVPSLQLLQQVMGSTSGVIYLIKEVNSIWFWGFEEVSKVFLPNISFLRDYGIPDAFIREWIRFIPSLFFRNTESFKNVVIMVDQQLGIPRDDSKKFLHTIFMFREPISDERLHSFKQIFKSFGWSDSHIRDLLRTNPSCLTLSQDIITQVLDILMTKLGYDPNYIASGPSTLFNSDFKTELVPRSEVFQILKEKGLIRMNQDFFGALLMSESDFEDNFVIPYEDVHQVYCKYIDIDIAKRSSTKRVTLNRIAQ